MDDCEDLVPEHVHRLQLLGSCPEDYLRALGSCVSHAHLDSHKAATNALDVLELICYVNSDGIGKSNSHASTKWPLRAHLGVPTVEGIDMLDCQLATKLIECWLHRGLHFRHSIGFIAS